MKENLAGSLRAPAAPHIPPILGGEADLEVLEPVGSDLVLRNPLRNPSLGQTGHPHNRRPASDRLDELCGIHAWQFNGLNVAPSSTSNVAAFSLLNAMKPFQKRMWRVLRAMGWKQAELARQGHVSPATVSLWLNGGTDTMSAEAAYHLEHKTGFRAKWMMFGEGPERAATDPRIVEVAAIMERMKNSDRNRMLRNARDWIAEAEEGAEGDQPEEDGPTPDPADELPSAQRAKKRPTRSSGKSQRRA